MSDGRELYIGLMSGTSADGIDAALLDFSTTPPSLVHQLAYPIPTAIKTRIYDLMVPGVNEIDRMGVLDRQLGELFAEATQELLHQAGVSPGAIAAIGSHGQTIRHRPPGQLEAAFTLQIGDPNVIAERSGITTVADFRRRDMAAGGQGAPLVPGFHQAIFGSADHDRVILNIGGIANLSFLFRAEQVLGFDTGPGNALMDAWIQRHHDKAYDADGAWAASGKSHSGLLSRLLGHPYFAQQAPKSTGRETFTLSWLDDALKEFPGLDPADVQATLLDLTATTISAQVLAKRRSGVQIYVCGGGAHNQRLMQALQAAMGEHRLGTTDELGLSPDWVEAAAFAWLARQCMVRRSGNIPSVTGASRKVILGSVYYSGSD